MNVAHPSERFQLRRFLLLVSRHWAENRKKYGLFLLAMFGILVVWLSFILAFSNLTLLDVTMQFVTYYVGLYLTGCIYASTLFSELSSKRDGANFLMLPASQLEKLLCVLLFGVLFFFITYTFLFYLVDIPMVQLSNRMLVNSPRNFPNSIVQIPPGAVYNIISAEQGPIPEKDIHLVLLGFFSVQAIFILGPIYFKKYVLVKSILVVLICLLIIVLVEEKVVNFFLPAGWMNLHLSWVQWDREEHPARFVYLPYPLAPVFIGLLQLGVPLAIWSITYLRLKEKQI